MQVSIRPWTPQDAPALAAVASATDRQYLSNRLPDPYTQKDALWYINLAQSVEGKGGLLRAVCVDGRVAGTVSVEQKRDIYSIDAELGYFLAPWAAGRGVMTRAVALMCSEAFGALDIGRISANVCAGNIASRRLLERNGFLLEGVVRRAVCKCGVVHDLCLYGRLK